jgi:hypothetical protein
MQHQEWSGRRREEFQLNQNKNAEIVLWTVEVFAYVCGGAYSQFASGAPYQGFLTKAVCSDTGMARARVVALVLGGLAVSFFVINHTISTPHPDQGPNTPTTRAAIHPLQSEQTDGLAPSIWSRASTSIVHATSSKLQFPKLQLIPGRKTAEWAQKEQEGHSCHNNAVFDVDWIQSAEGIAGGNHTCVVYNKVCFDQNMVVMYDPKYNMYNGTKMPTFDLHGIGVRPFFQLQNNLNP